MRHSELRGAFANLFGDVCHDVEIETHFQQWLGESFALKSITTDNGAQSDINANGLWESRFDKTQFDFKILSTS